MDLRSSDKFKKEGSINGVKNLFRNNYKKNPKLENLKFDVVPCVMAQQSTSKQQSDDINEEVSRKGQEHQDESVSANQQIDTPSYLDKSQTIIVAPPSMEQSRIDQEDEQKTQIFSGMAESSKHRADAEVNEIKDLQEASFKDAVAKVKEIKDLQKAAFKNVCLLCDKICPSNSDYTEHLSGQFSSDGYKCNECALLPILTQNTILKYKEICNRAYHAKHIKGIFHSYVCTYCSNAYKLESDIIDHCANHKTPGGYKCLVCDRLFESTNAILTHSKMHLGDIHEEIRKANRKTPLSNTCSTNSESATDRKDDIQEKETDKKSDCCSSEETFYVCNFCRTEFQSKSDALIHSARHRPSKGFKCLLCLKVMKRKIDLSNHYENCSKRRYYSESMSDSDST